VTGLSNGQIVVLYSPVTSLNGAKLLLSKEPPRKVTIEDMSDTLAAPTILPPHGLPMFRDFDPGRGTKRKREKDRVDPRKSRRPELLVTGPGQGGRVGASATQHVVQNLVRDTTRDVDVSAYFYVAGDDLTGSQPREQDIVPPTYAELLELLNSLREGTLLDFCQQAQIQRFRECLKLQPTSSLTVISRNTLSYHC
jgi:hypothetical protein